MRWFRKNPDPASNPQPAPGIPAARPVRHLRTLWWWILVGVMAVMSQSQVIGSSGPVPLNKAPGPRTEQEAFIAFVFGKVSATDPAAIRVEDLRRQLQALKDSGAHSIHLEEVRAFLAMRAPLPKKPVLLVFDEAKLETIEAVDPILRDLGFTAVTFVSVEDIEGGNVGLVSRRRLARMTDSGRWEVGVRACNTEQETAAQLAQTGAAHYQAKHDALQGWSRRPVLAISCLRGWPADPDLQAGWHDALLKMEMPLGFVARGPGANHQDDDPTSLRLIRIPSEENEATALVRHMATYSPRHERFVETFAGEKLGSAWIAHGADAQVKNGELRLAATADDIGSTLFLGGTERWRDGRVMVELAAAPSGQFWIYARRSSTDAFVRLGAVGRRVVMQKSDESGQTRQVAERLVGSGPIKLELRVIGSRATAYLDGKPLLDRPTELAGRVREGPVSLAAWTDEGQATAHVRHVEAEPLARQIVMLPAEPDEASYAGLRQQADGLWAISPRLFSWEKSEAKTTTQMDAALRIFVGHHHLVLLPAVKIKALPQKQEWAGFDEDMLAWVEQPGFAGLNLVVDTIRPADIAALETLRGAFLARGKTLALTIPRGALATPPNFVWFTDENSGVASLEFANSKTRLNPG
jgi:hypothetical protein